MDLSVQFVVRSAGACWAEMCIAMCVGGGALNALVFVVAALGVLSSEDLH